MNRKGRVLSSLLAAIVFGLISDPANAVEWFDRDCLITAGDAPKDAPRFEDFPAPAIHIEKPHPVDFTGNRLAWRFRTVIRQGAAEGPNFAGHYTFVSWGCGSSCAAWAIVDSISGHVFMSRDFGALSTVFVGGDDPSFTISFRRDSNLMILFGAPNEDEEREGITYLVWNGHDMKVIRFISRTDLCAGGPPK